MWDEPFDTAMIGTCVVINCPDEDSERELAAVLDGLGIKYPDGKSLLSVKNVWDVYKERFCYFLEGTRARRGPQSSASDSYWLRYKRCTFYGGHDDISDESFTAILKSESGVRS